MERRTGGVLSRWVEALGHALAPRAYSAIVFGALLCNLAAKLFHAGRYGLLREFTATWIREEDVEWSATFEWNGTTEMLVRAGDPTVPGQSVLEGLQASDDTAAMRPDYMRDAYASAITASRRAHRDRALQLLGGVRNVMQKIGTAAQKAQSITSRATYLAADGIGLAQKLRDESYVLGSLFDDVAGVFGVEVWRMRLSSDVLRVSAAAAKEAAATDLAFQPPAQEVVVVRQRTSLRQLAIEAYGNADAWTEIARANQLETSVVEAGARVVIPRRSQLLVDGGTF